MSQFAPKDPAYKEKVTDSFGRQVVMQTLGVKLVTVEAGYVVLEFQHHERLTQQHGFIHAGILTTVVDSACGYAAFSLMPPASAVLTIEFKSNFLSPAKGERFLAVGSVKKAGRTITVCDGEVFAIQGEAKKLVATMTCTLMCVQERADLTG